jgi:outer membrane protein assembly factor BamB
VETAAFHAGGGAARRYLANENLHLPFRLLWRHCIESEQAPGQPLVADDRLIVPDTAFGDGCATLHCLTADGGDVLWRRRSPTLGVTVLGCIADGAAVWYSCVDPPQLTAINVESGECRWTTDAIAPASLRAVARGDALFLDSVTGDASMLCASSLATGNTIWTAACPFFIGAIAADDDRILVLEAGSPAGGHPHRIASYSLRGEPQWIVDIDNCGIPSGLVGHVAVAGGRVYCPLGGPRLLCLAAENGRTAWIYDFDEGVAGAPVVHDRTIYLFTSDRSFVIDAETGRDLTPPRAHLPWSRPTAGISTRNHYVCSTRTELAVHDLKEQVVVWSYAGRFGEPVVAGGRVYASSPDGHLYCFGSA